MLLDARLTNVPCSNLDSESGMKDVDHLFKKQAKNLFYPYQSYQTPVNSQYGNFRINQRFKQHLSKKKPSHDVFINRNSPVTFPDIFSTGNDGEKENDSTLQRSVVEPKPYCINDYISAIALTKETFNKNPVELDPLHSRIQLDLIKLRKLIKTKQKKSNDNSPGKTRTLKRQKNGSPYIGILFDDQDNGNTSNTQRSCSLKKLKPLDHVKISGSQLHHSMLSKSDSAGSGNGCTSNSSSTCSQYSKQQQQQQKQELDRQEEQHQHHEQEQEQEQEQHQCKRKSRLKNNSKSLHVNQSRPNPPPPEPLMHRASHLSTKPSKASSKIAQNIFSKKQIPSSPVSRSTPPTTSEANKDQSNLKKKETPSAKERPSPSDEELATRHYNYAASTSSRTPHSTMIKRNASLLPILLQSSSCVGTQTHDSHPEINEYNSEEQTQNRTDDEYCRHDNTDCCYQLLNYKHLINCLPKPVILIRSRYGQDDYGILFEQLDHIRETMPNTSIYKNYARVS